MRLTKVAHENGATHGAVRLAKDVERRTPAVVLVKPLADGTAEGARVLLEAIDALGVVALGHEGPARAQGIRKDEVGLTQQGAGVIHDLVSCTHEVHPVGHHATRPKAAKVDGHRGRAGATVVAEGHRALVGVHLAAINGRGNIGDVEHAPLEDLVAVDDVQVASCGHVVDRLVTNMPRELRTLCLRDLVGRSLALATATATALALSHVRPPYSIPSMSQRVSM